MWAFEQIVPTELTNEEKKIYTRYSANWTYLSAFLASRAVTLRELGIMLKLEIDGKGRDFIIARLLGRIGTLYREHLQYEAFTCRDEEAKRKKKARVDKWLIENGLPPSE